MIGACNACQLHCEHCAHRGLLSDDPGYQMPLEDISTLLNRMWGTNTQVDIFMLNGPGEPLLWRHFNDAVRMLRLSQLGCQIKVVTNGLRLNIIAEDVWPMLDRVCISTYGQPLDASLIARHAERIEYLAGKAFLTVVPGSLPVASPTFCSCCGPLYYKRHIFPHCGPPMFEAARLAGMDPFLCGGASPLEQWSPDAMPRINLPCAWCWANGAVPKVNVENTPRTFETPY